MSAPTRPKPADAAAVAHCPHCGTAVEGAADAFCCGGCEAAHAIIHGAGLDRWYAERAAYAPRPEPLAGWWDAVPVETGADGACTVHLAVDGLRCASCVWLAEHVLQATPGVRDAHVSYATGRATLRWDPAATDLPALARRIAALGYRPRPLTEAARPDRGLMLRLGVATFVSMNVMLLAASLYAGWWGGMDPAFAALFRWTMLALATPVATWCAAPFYQGALAGLRHRQLHMDLPVSLGLLILYGHGLVATVLGHDGYLDSMVMLVMLMLAGRVLESRGRRRALEAATALAGSAPRTARRVAGDSVETVPVAELAPGDLIDVGPGEELAADGVVTQGAGQVRLALLTGESEPVAVEPGRRVVAGALLADGALTVRVEATGQDTMLQRMARELERAADRSLRPTAADRLAPWFTAATLALAALAFGGWYLAAGLDKAIMTTVAVLVVACPCAIALSQPLASAAGLGAAARRGLLFRSTDALLKLNDVTHVALDKTGTVTEGELAVVRADDATLRLAAGLERHSSHPIARAILAEARRRGIPLPRATDVRETPGRGVEGILDGGCHALRSGGPGVVELVGPVGVAGRIELADQVRADARHAVAALERLGLGVTLLTGDRAEVAERIGREIGVRSLRAAMTPDAKADWVRARQQAGERVLVAGDGLNDGPALAAADVGVAMGTGAASSVLVADGVIAGDGVMPLVGAVRAARACERAILANQRRSLLYNGVAVTAAFAGLINPLVAVCLMPLSSGIVIWGALRVERVVRQAEAA